MFVMNIELSVRSGSEQLQSQTFKTAFRQQKWVAAPLHQEVWPQIEGHCVNYVVHTYTSI
jgi:hypothetical protein